MPDLTFAYDHLNAAKAELENINSGDMNKQAFYWNSFVSHLNAVFIKAERSCQDIKNKFQPFQGYYIKQRRNDPLLRYLKESRDAAEHSIDILCHITLGEALEGSFATIGADDGSPDQTIPIYCLKYQLKTFVINGSAHIPPTTHLGKPLKFYRDAFEVGYLGVNYYSEFLESVKTKFDIKS